MIPAPNSNLSPGDKAFQYQTRCKSLEGLRIYSDRQLQVGETYDVYFADYHFSDEYEIYQQGVYYTSFILSGRYSGEEDEIFNRYFYNRAHMIQIQREEKINQLGIS